MKIETIIVGPFGVNCLVLGNDRQNALVIDPGDDGPMICDVLREKQLMVAAYVLTHGHCDHICGLYDCYQAFPAPVYMHPMDARWAFSSTNQLPPYYAPARKPATEILLREDGESIAFDSAELKVIHTPGHSPGGICLYLEEERLLISGDTLFRGSVGRTDLPGGDPRQLAASLKRLKALPDQTTIYPGHGAHTTMAYEKKHNFFMR
ncbi:MAG: MBL fold metallo-hydrolase [Spartobacteria bacterium]|nr:MBL fold metallo-hydrolase [Spartobacteria bacterium]